jgi:hypothetical protein
LFKFFHRRVYWSTNVLIFRTIWDFDFSIIFSAVTLYASLCWYLDVDTWWKKTCKTERFFGKISASKFCWKVPISQPLSLIFSPVLLSILWKIIIFIKIEFLFDFIIFYHFDRTESLFTINIIEQKKNLGQLRWF